MIRKKLFGKRIKVLRKNKGLTQEKLVERMDISLNYLSSMERGLENPTFDMLMKISDALEVEIMELFNYRHDENLYELRKIMSRFAKELDEEKLKLAIKIVGALNF
jgi:transcriptional regulator with XRE-family HTH domain